MLLADITGRSVAWVMAHGEAAIDETKLEPLIRRRLAGEPLQYIRRKTEFFGREFYVDDRVLIPRPETELLVEAAIERAPRGGRLVDVGTGSGCIAVSIANARPDLFVVAADLSVAALAVATRNGVRHGVASDVLTAFRKPFDIVVSNPPYIAAAEVDGLMTEVRDHEPRIALTPGARGTEVIDRILDAAGKALVLMEIGYGQETAVRDVAAAHRFAVEEARKDLAGIPRVVILSSHAD